MLTRWTSFLLLMCLLFFLGATCEIEEDENDPPEEIEEPPAVPTVSDPIMVVPSDGLPDGLPLQPANNNLDVVNHQGRIFLAFRTAPNHFASAEAMIHVVSSADQETWDYETSFTLGLDVREPRLLSFGDKLFLYFAVLGDDPLDFAPGEMRMSEYLAPGNWTQHKTIYLEGFIPWRTKTIDGTAYMLGYIGGESIYDVNPEPIEVHWLTTTDGRNWQPVVPGKPVVLLGGGSETDFVYHEGAVIAVSRNELGDETGFGMKICRAEPESIGDWTCVGDPRKYDSPLLFNHEDQVFLVGRRNLSANGNYDLGLVNLSPLAQRLLNELVYWFEPKRCALWEVDPYSLDVTFVLDLPSAGDTCFPGILYHEPGVYQIYNYTSPLENPEAFWLEGQRGPTSIIRSDIFLP